MQHSIAMWMNASASAHSAKRSRRRCRHTGALGSAAPRALKSARSAARRPHRLREDPSSHCAAAATLSAKSAWSAGFETALRAASRSRARSTAVLNHSNKLSSTRCSGPSDSTSTLDSSSNRRAACAAARPQDAQTRAGGKTRSRMGLRNSTARRVGAAAAYSATCSRIMRATAAKHMQRSALQRPIATPAASPHLARRRLLPSGCFAWSARRDAALAAVPTSPAPRDATR